MKFLLLPFSWIYGFIIKLRNVCYDLGLFKSRSFAFPVIVVGNLRVGGTGKTPMILALLDRLDPQSEWAVLSRGYGRSTKGWQIVGTDHAPNQVGDEPLLIKRSRPSTTVVVMEDRVAGITKLRKGNPEPRVVLLDDAMQHRSVKPGHLILLTAYHDLYTRDWLLPAGRLREHRKSASRADTIVVTKCPKELSGPERHALETELKPFAHQKVCFAFEDYPGLTRLATSESRPWDAFEVEKVLLITGLADPTTLVRYLEERGLEVNSIRYKDHHAYSPTDMERIQSEWNRLKDEKTMLLTTEKDGVRLHKFLQNEKFADLPFHSIQHRLDWFEKDKKIIEKRLNEFIASYSRNG